MPTSESADVPFTASCTEDYCLWDWLIQRAFAAVGIARTTLVTIHALFDAFSLRQIRIPLHKNNKLEPHTIKKLICEFGIYKLRGWRDN